MNTTASPDSRAPDARATTVVVPRIEGRLVSRTELTAVTIEAMFTLLLAHFTGVCRATFEADLAEKNWVILLEDEDGQLRGFSTLLIYVSQAAGGEVTVVYSGDTIVDRASWGSPALARTWIHSVRQRAAMSGSRDFYWLLLTSGFRTYRFLPVFFRSFHPRFDEATPPGSQALLDLLAFERFGARYDPFSGVVRLQRPQVLAPDLLEVPAGRRAVDDHVAFFLARNAGYVRGDELVCLTRIDDSNLTAAGRRMARSDAR